MFDTVFNIFAVTGLVLVFLLALLGAQMVIAAMGFAFKYAIANHRAARLARAPQEVKEQFEKDFGEKDDAKGDK